MSRSRGPFPKETEPGEKKKDEECDGPQQRQTDQCQAVQHVVEIIAIGRDALALDRRSHAPEKKADPADVDDASGQPKNGVHTFSFFARASFGFLGPKQPVRQTKPRRAQVNVAVLADEVQPEGLDTHPVGGAAVLGVHADRDRGVAEEHTHTPELDFLLAPQKERVETRLQLVEH